MSTNNNKDYILEKEIYDIGKDTDNNPCTTEDLHAVLLKAAIEFDRVCRKNNIPYAFGFGSALGMYNYHGFIPWDDDMDFVIDYKDINRLVEACEKDLNEGFALECYENNKKYNVLIPTMKFRVKDSYLKEKNWFTLPNKCGNGQTVYIDVVAFMGVPEDEKEHKKLVRYSKRRMIPYVFLDAFLRINPYRMKRKMKEFERKVAEKYEDSPVVSQTVITPFQDMSSLVHYNAFPREVIYPFREYEFEGHKFYSFNDVKTFCSMRYGEKSLRKWDGEKWYDPFPIEKRKPGHLNKFNFHHKK